MARMKLRMMMSAKRRMVTRAKWSNRRDTASGGGCERRGINGRQIRRRGDAERRKIERQRGALHHIFGNALPRGLKIPAIRRWITEGGR